jgi:hypothetical protein
MTENILCLMGLREDFISDREIKFPEGYLIDGDGNNWEIVNPKAGPHKVILKQVGAEITIVANIVEDQFERFVPNNDVDDMLKLLKEKFRK